MLQAIADPFKAWADSALHMINQHDGKSLHRVHGLTPAQFGEHVPGSDADKTKWIMALTDDIFSVIETMTIDDLEYSDQYNLAQASALFQHQTFITRNEAAKAAYKTSPKMSGQLDFTDALNNFSNMGGGSNTPDPIMKQQHRTALHLLCLQKDESGKYSIPAQFNPGIETILKSGMKATGPMALNRALG